MKILLPFDGSECSLRAVSSLLEQRVHWRDGLVVHLLHVHPPIPIGLVQSHVSHESLQRHYREDGEAILRPAVDRLTGAGVEFVQHIHVGQPAESIAHLANDLGCDLIVMGTHGRGAVGQMLLGSVAATVVHLAPCPVQLIR